MAGRDAALSYALRGRVLGKYLGQLGLMLAALALVPLVVSLVERETALTLRYGEVILVLLALGAPLARLRPPDRIREAEALAVVALAFVGSALVMTWPFTGAGLPFVDALFETVSGVTTTGLSTVADPALMPRTFRFARAWMQWYGGLGIAVLSVALLMGHHAAARRLAGATGAESLAAATRTYARRILKVYLVLTGLGFGAMLLTGADPFTAAVHVFAAVSTGGFSPFADSLAGLPSGPPRVVLTVLSFAGAVSLPLYWVAFHGKAGGRRAGWRVLGDPELKTLAGLAAAVVALLALALHLQGRMPWGRAAAEGFYMGISAQSTTGFATLPVAGMPSTALAVMIVAMSAGGSVGSTAGGIKLLRVLILAAVVRTALRTATAPPHAVVAPRLGGNALEPEDTVRALALIALFAAVVLASWLPFLAAGYEPLGSLFEVVSATATVGLSNGITSADLEPGLKAVLMADMLLGRVEIVALLVLFYPRTWIGPRG
jgi:trk system potassium uptake protein TrkH